MQTALFSTIAVLLGLWTATPAHALDTPAQVMSTEAPSAKEQHTSEDVEFTASVWADNWFALYVNGELVGEDSVPITTMRSFNADTFSFRARYPLTIALVSRDYIENDTGLEYIGSLFGLVPLGHWFTLTQQIGDGGLIAQITETASGAVAASTSKDWRGYVTHKAPLNPTCEKSRQPVVDCLYTIKDEPAGWKEEGFDDTNWTNATEYTEDQIGARFGYHDIEWDASARLIWTDDINADNTILWRLTVEAPR
ncbi:MAG: PEBP family protein [Pseudomonadota bacterium]